MADIDVAITFPPETQTYITKSMWIFGGVLVCVIAIYFLFKKA